jgi:hypothetical protein
MHRRWLREGEMKHAMAIVAFLILAVGARADTIVDVTATQCDLCLATPSEPSGPQLTPIDLELQLTVEQVTGEFLVPGYDMDFEQTVDEITSASGTLNGNPISFIPDGYYLTLGNFQLGWLCFYANTQESCASNDFENNLLSGEQITWDATDPSPNVPEPGSLFLSLFGLAAVFGLALTRRS